ncbi:hypothetical protein H6P81_005317 [Aristolochia fimbriata]|uniref:Pentatricopeptide repeat-containing protein n=1 Tax=Aristolochia fimbriata TaxID=158543 RepID=A0AAV7EUM1_ARIFI|nr:hypothetical protein H6P81_005317 [Aristolochia fimbriata]
MRVIGHAVVCNVDGALKLFSKMRFNGRDLKSFACHVLLNHFVEGDRLKGADTISEEISSRGLENPVARCIRLKDLFLQNKVEEAKMYFLELEKSEFKFDERFISSLTSILCKQGNFWEAQSLLEMYKSSSCGVRKLDKMIKLLEVDSEGSAMLDNVVWNKYILSFCEAGSAYEDFLIPKVLQIPGFVLDRCLVCRLINDFVKRKRGDLATELLLKNREYGRIMPKRSCLTLIRFLCEMSQLKEVFDLLEKLLTGEESEDRYIFNCFIEGVGYAKKPEIAQKLFSRMIVRGVRPCMTTKILLLHGYLEGGWIPTAMHSFDTFAKKGGPGTKQGQREEAKRLHEEMECKGFYPSEKTRLMWDVMMSSGS